MKANRSLVFLLSGVALLVLFAGAAAAAPGAADTPDGNETTIEKVTLTDMDTGTVYVIPPDADLSTLGLPSGEYVRTRYIRTGDRIRIGRDVVRIAKTSTQATSDFGLSAAVGSTFGFAGGSSSTVDIWVGAVNDTGEVPETVSDVSLTIEVTRPDGTVETFNRTTGPNGNAHVEYSIAGDGQYQISISSPNTSSVTGTSFSAGEHTEVYPGIAEIAEVGREVRMEVLVTDDNRTPVANVQRNVTITTPNGTTITRTVMTGSSGFATVRFTPKDPGDYFVSAGDSFGASLQAGVATARTAVNGDRFSAFLFSNQTAHISGQVRDGGQLYGNEQITVRIINNSAFFGSNVAANITTTTNAFGQFNVQWQAPQTDSEQLFYEVELYTAAGKRIAAEDHGIFVEPFPEERKREHLEIDTEFAQEGWSPTYKPGENATVVVTVEDDGSPVENADVTLGAAAGWQGVPLEITTLTTNASGMATYTFDIPASAPDNVPLIAPAFARHGGLNGSDTAYADLQYMDVEKHIEGWGEGVAPGSSITYNLTATDAATDDPVSGVPVTAAGETFGYHASAFDPGAAETSSGGLAQMTIDVPSDARNAFHIADGAPYDPFNWFPYLQIRSYGLSLSGLQHEYAPGDTVSFTVDADTSESVSANIVVSTWANDRTDQAVLFSGIVSAGDQVSFTIPSTVPQGISYEITVRTVSDSGETTLANEFFRVEGEGPANAPPSASFTYEPTSPTAGASVSFNASGSSDSDGSIASYEWDFDSDGTVDATGETVSHTFSSAGDYDVTLTVTDDDGATDSTTKTVSVQAGSTGETTVKVQLDGAPNGLQKYNATVSGPSNATIKSVKAGLISGNSFEIRSGGQGASSVTARAVDLIGSVGSFSDTRTLFTVTYEGQHDASAFTVTVHTLVDDDSNDMDTSHVSLDVSAGAAGPGDVTGNGKPAKDPDGDGLFEDVDGDGDVDFTDAIELAFLPDASPQFFDFNGDGNVDFADAIELAFAS